MNEITAYCNDVDMEGSFLSKKLIIRRNLSTRHVIPGVGQWMVCSDKHSECWRCNQHILTIILWSHRIGVLTGEKDIRKVDYYQDKIDEIYDLDEALPLNAS